MADAEAATEGRPGLPAVVAQVPAGEVVRRLDTAARRGKLPGFAGSGETFRVLAYGNPFDYALLGRVVADGEGSRIWFGLSPMRKLPAVFALILILTVWPGVLLTDTFLRNTLGFYGSWTNAGLRTWWWYLPLTVLPLPWLWLGWVRRSRAAAEDSARERIAQVAETLGGRVIDPA